MRPIRSRFLRLLRFGLGLRSSEPRVPFNIDYVGDSTLQKLIRIFLQAFLLRFRPRAHSFRIALASAKPWPARTMAASARSLRRAIGRSPSPNGPRRRFRANRSAASTASEFASAQRLLPILLADPRRPKRLVDPPRSIAARRQRPRLRQSEGRVVDVAELGKPLDDPARYRPRASPLPSALADLALKIGGSFALLVAKRPT